MQEHLPATLPHHQFAVMGSAMGIKGKGAGRREKATKAENKQELPSTQRSIHFREGACFVLRGSSTKCISLKRRDHGVNYTRFVRYSVNDNRLLIGVI